MRNLLREFLLRGERMKKINVEEWGLLKKIYFLIIIT